MGLTVGLPQCDSPFFSSPKEKGRKHLQALQTL